MTARTRRSLGALLALLAPALVAAVAHGDDAPAIPPTPAPIADVIAVRSFTLDRAATHEWRAERQTYRSGYLLVLRVDPALVVPRQTPEPVLYVGDQTAQRVNPGATSGRIVVIVPAVLDDPKHPDSIDLDQALVWFGTPALPEEVDARTIAREEQNARRAGIERLDPRRLAAARNRGGALLRARTADDVTREAVRLILRHAPEDREMAESLLDTAE